MLSLETLERSLGDRVVGGGELATRLAVSAPTLSRLVARAGDRVVRIGRTRGARYIRTRALPEVGTRLPVYSVSEKGILQEQGELRLLAGGRHGFSRGGVTEALYEGLPPQAADMCPQGYLGRGFARQHANLGLPPRLDEWSDDHHLVALARRGEDCVGRWMLGRESLDRWLASELKPVDPHDYPVRARAAAMGWAGPQLGGAQPKFTLFSEGRHVLVKFALGEGPASERRRALLVCEALALRAIRGAGLAAATAQWRELDGGTYLEVERFDRVGERGRRGLISLFALDNEHFGVGSSWIRASARMQREGWLEPQDARRVRWLDVFGSLIGNGDRHLGNLSFFETPNPRRVRLAPAYDMTPTRFAPDAEQLVERPFTPAPPTADTRDVWPSAAAAAAVFWQGVTDEPAAGDDMRRIAERCLASVRASMRG